MNYEKEIYSNAAGRASKQPNLYFRSIFRPDLPSVIPDLDEFTASVLKQITLSAQYTMAGSGNVILWYPHMDLPARVILLAYDAVTGTYNPLQLFRFDEDVTRNFVKGRTTSSFIKVISNTVTGNAFTVSGAAVGTSYQTLPPFNHPSNDESTVTYQTVTAWARNPSCRQTQTPIAQGIIALGHPEGINDYYPLEGSLINNTDPISTTDTARTFGFIQGPRRAFISSSSAQNDGVAARAANGWPVGSAVIPAGTANFKLFDSDLCQNAQGDFVPPNASGKIRVSGVVSATASKQGAQMTVRIGVTIAYANPVSFARSTVEIFIATVIFQCETDNGFNGSHTFDQTVDINQYANTANESFYWIDRITYTVTTNGVANWTTNYSADGPSNTICVDWLSLGDPWYNGPGSLIAVSGVSVGQVLGISGLCNMELVPNSNLSRNLPTNLTYIKNNKDLAMANHIIANAHLVALKFVYSVPEYMAVMDDLERLSIRGNLEGMSAGFFEGLKSFWRKWLAPGLKAALPMIGGLLGPEGVVAGNAVSGLIPTYEIEQNADRQAAGRYANGDKGEASGSRNPYLGYCAGTKPAWDLSDSEFIKYVNTLLRGRTLVIFDIVALLCYNPVSMNFDGTKGVELTARVKALADKGYFLRVDVSQTVYIGPKQKFDRIKECTTWARKVNRFTITQLCEAFDLKEDYAEDVVVDLLNIGEIKVLHTQEHVCTYQTTTDDKTTNDNSNNTPTTVAGARTTPPASGRADETPLKK